MKGLALLLYGTPLLPASGCHQAILREKQLLNLHPTEWNGTFTELQVIRKGKFVKSLHKVLEPTHRLPTVLAITSKVITGAFKPRGLDKDITI